MKYLITHSLSRKEKDIYEKKGFYCYDLRDCDFGNDIASIERKVLVNRVGSMITREKINFGQDDYIDYNQFCSSKDNKLVENIKDLITTKEKINFSKLEKDLNKLLKNERER